jgi:ABC-2 type transport system permease protein
VTSVLVITIRDILAQVRSRSFLVQTLLLPVVLTLIIGNALGGQRRITPISVAVVGSGEIATSLENLLNDTKIANATRYTAQNASTALSEGRAIMRVELPERFETQLLRNRPLEVLITSDAANHERAKIVDDFVRGYVQQLEVARATILGATRALQPGTSQELVQTLTAVRTKVEAQLQAAPIDFQTDQASGRSQGFFAYYAIAFGVMFTLLSATNGAGGVLDELERGTLHRLLAAPVTPATLLFSKFLALWVLSALQLGAFALLSSLLFGVNWGTPIEFLMVLLATAAAAAGFGGIIVGISRSREQLTTLALGFVLVMSLLGGSMYPIETLPGIAQFLSRFTYNRWSIEAFQLIAAGSQSPQVGFAVLVLMGMAAAGVLFGAFSLSRRFTQ